MYVRRGMQSRFANPYRPAVCDLKRMPAFKHPFPTYSLLPSHHCQLNAKGPRVAVSVEDPRRRQASTSMLAAERSDATWEEGKSTVTLTESTLFATYAIIGF